MSTRSSRRTFLRSAGLMTGGLALARFAPRTLGLETLSARQAAAQPSAAAQASGAGQAAADPLAAIRAQMAAVPIQSTRLGERLVMLSGPGGNVVVLHGPDGKIVVDSFVQSVWPKLKAELDAIDARPVKTLIDTHWHFDHTDNNANFRAAGAAIVAHVNTKTRLGQPHDLLGMHLAPSPAEFFPTQTFSERQGIRSNGEEIEMFHLPPAHTDGDIFVHYRKADVLHTGDVFFNGVYPVIDAGTGGHINGTIAGARRALALVNTRTKIVPGHGPLADRGALETYVKVLTTVRDRVQEQKKAGKSLAEVQAAKPSAEFDAAWGKGLMPPDNFVAEVYNTL